MPCFLLPPPHSVLTFSGVAHICPLPSWKPLTKYPSKRWVSLIAPGTLHSGNCSFRARMLGLLLTGVWQAAWLLWQHLGWSHRTISSSALLAQRASSKKAWALGRGRREERDRRERREGRTSWTFPRGLGYAFPCSRACGLNCREVTSLSSEQDSPATGSQFCCSVLVSQSDPIIQLCECISPHRTQRKEGAAPSPGEHGAGVERQEGPK